MKAGGIFGGSFSGLGAVDVELQQAACGAANNLGREDGIHGNHRSTSQVVAYMDSFMDMQDVSTTAVFGCYEAGYAQGAAEYEASKGHTVNTPRPDTASEDDQSIWAAALTAITPGGSSTPSTPAQKETLKSAACEMATYMGREHGISIGKVQSTSVVRTYMNQRIEGLEGSDVTDAFIYGCYMTGFKQGDLEYNKKGDIANDPRANAADTEKAFIAAVSTGDGATVGTKTGAKTGATGTKTPATTGGGGGGGGGGGTPAPEAGPQKKQLPIALIAGGGLLAVGAVLLLTKKKKGDKDKPPSKKPTKR